MTKLIAIVPTPEYREALLWDGPCGSHPPHIWYADQWQEVDAIGRIHTHTVDGGSWRPGRIRGHTIGGKEALPLLWDGKPVPDGIARAVRALNALPESELPDRYEYINCYEWTRPDSILAITRYLQKHGIAAEVIIVELKEKT